jgi:hypothetical protein
MDIGTLENKKWQIDEDVAHILSGLFNLLIE